jgi:hypothetical protein
LRATGAAALIFALPSWDAVIVHCPSGQVNLRAVQRASATSRKTNY